MSTGPDTTQRHGTCRRFLHSGAGMLVVSLALLVLVFAYYAATYKTVSRFVRIWDGERILYCDFTRHYYATGREILARGLPAEGFYYSAFFALCLVPISRLALPQATHVWTGLQLAASALLVVLPGLHLGRQGRRDYYLYLVLALLSAPMVHNFRWGQVSAALTVCILGALLLYLRGWKTSAGALLALATSIKFYPGLLAVYFLVKREFRLLAAFVVLTAALLVAVPIATLGGHGFVRFQRAVVEALQEARPDIEINVNSQYFPAVMLRYRNMAHALRTPAPKDGKYRPTMREERRYRDLIARHETVIARRDWDLGPLRIAGLGIFAVNLVLAHALVRAKCEDCDLAAFALLLLSLPFVVETMWPHYFVYLPFCQVVCYRLLRDDSSCRARRRISMALFCLSALLASTVLFNLLGNWIAYSWSGCLFWSNTLLLLGLHLQGIPRILAARRRQRGAGNVPQPADSIGQAAPQRAGD